MRLPKVTVAPVAPGVVVPEVELGKVSASAAPRTEISSRPNTSAIPPDAPALLPINANADSRWGVRYALQRQLEGTPVEVVLLNVGEFVTQWQVLRFRTR